MEGDSAYDGGEQMGFKAQGNLQRTKEDGMNTKYDALIKNWDWDPYDHNYEDSKKEEEKKEEKSEDE